MPPVKNVKEEIHYEITGIILLALAALIAISIANPAMGVLGRLINRMLMIMAGEGRYLFPLLLAVVGFKMLFRKSKIKRNVNIYGVFIATLTVLTILHLAVPGEYALKAGLQGDGGGLLGGLVYFLLLNSFGVTGMYIVLVALFLVAVLLLTNQPVSMLLANIIRKTVTALKKTVRMVDEFLFSPIEEKNEDMTDIIEEPESAEVKREYPSDTGEDSYQQAGVRVRDAEPKKNEGKKSNIIYYRPQSRNEARNERGNGIKDSQLNREPVTITMETELEITEGEPQVTPIERANLPPIGILAKPLRGKTGRNRADISANVKRLEEILTSFGIRARVTQVSHGPVITRYEIQPPPGVKVSRIVGLADDIALGMAAPDVRIEAPVPGKSVVGIEVPNKEIATVYLRELVETEEFQRLPSCLTMALGKDVAGNPILDDLARMPHLLIAGATGAGKSVCLNTLIAGILFKSTPEQVKFLIIDPKKVELATFNGIPHLVSPVVTDPRKAATSLRWAVREMEYRYELFALSGSRDIARYNEMMRRQGGQQLPLIVIIIDELADLMMVSPADVEDAICRLAQMARAAGIHLVVATQRPSVDIITGLIKANIPSRISFAVSSQIDSRTILDMGGAEKLLGRGDMLFYPVGATKPIRVQGAYLSDREVELLVNFWRKQADPEYDETLGREVAATKEHSSDEDELLARALKIFIETGHGSISLLQRRLHIGYARAARLMDIMEKNGYVGGYEGSKPRSVLISKDEYEQKYGEMFNIRAGNDK